MKTILTWWIAMLLTIISFMLADIAVRLNRATVLVIDSNNIVTVIATPKE